MRFSCTLAIAIVLGFSFLWSSCTNEGGEDIPEVSNIQVRIEIVRLDSILRVLDTANISNELTALNTAYPSISELYFKRILGLGATADASLDRDVKMYLQSENSARLLDTIEQVYPDLSFLHEELSDAFRRAKYYLDSVEVPRFFTLTSDFGYQRFIFDDDEGDGVGIGLDLFLGEDFPYKSLDPQNPAFSDYLTRAFNKDHMTTKIMELIFDDRYPNNMGVRLLDHIIHNGKRIYLMDKVLPFVNDTVIMEYTAKQMEFVNEYEAEMWTYFIDENLLYETNQQKIAKYISPSPNSPGMPPAAPGRTGNYIGWQIVKAYMKKFPETTVDQLFELKDGQQFLEAARYRPSR